MESSPLLFVLNLIPLGICVFVAEAEFALCNLFDDSDREIALLGGTFGAILFAELWFELSL